MNKHVNKNKPVKPRADYGTVPVVSAPLIRQMTQQAAEAKGIPPAEPKRSLRQHILVAKTLEEVNDLLVIGAAFQQATPKTQRRWERAAAARRSQLLPA